MPAGISAHPSGAVGRRLVRMRACLRRARLDAALAQGADPWSSGELMARAARLGSLPEREGVASGLVALVALAEHQRPASQYLKIRHRVVLEQRESLLALAERLRQPAPVEVAVVAQLVVLLTDPSSPVFAGGNHPDRLAEATSRCLQSVSNDLASD
jgi:hypothetical protein